MKMKKKFRMEKYHFLPCLLFALAGVFSFVSCSDDDSPYTPGNNPGNEYTIDENIKYLSSKLFNTSWTYQYTEFYTGDYGRYSHTNSDFGNKFTFTFSNEIYGNNEYKLIVNGNTNAACWWHIDENGVDYSATDYGYRFTNMSAADVGSWTTCGGSIFDGYISMQTNSKLIIKDYYSDGIKYIQHIYTASSNPGGTGGSGGGSDSYEKPEIGFYDFTATKTSLKVQYEIYNKEEAGVTSAKIYYGTSSNPSSSRTATVSGSLITANISGLRAGTTYYVKCVATGKGGTTTTATTRCITNY